MGFGRIMIVEDHRVIARDLQWELETLGYQVVGIEASGEAAVQQAELLQPDLVIMDIILRGEMDGIDAAGTIGARLRIPVVYLTAHSDQSSLERIKASQPFGYLTKPFSSSELHGTIETALYKHRMEELLRASERRLEFALEGAELTMWDWDVTTGEVVRDNRFTRILGYPFGETATDVETWQSFIHPKDKPEVIRVLEEHLEGKSQAFEKEYRVRTSSGTWKWILDRGKVIERGHSGKPLRMVGTFMDVSDRKKAEDDLRRSEARSKALLAAIPDTMFLLSATGEILDFHNEESDRLFLHPDVVVGRRLDGVFPAEIAAMYGYHMEPALHGGGARIFEYRFDVPNRGPLDFEARMVSAGESEVLAIVRNVTEKKAAQEALRQSEEKYRLVVDNASEGIAVVQDQMLKFVNARVREITGYSEEKLTSRPFIDFIHPDDVPTVSTRYWNRVRGERSPESTRFRVFDSDGEVKWVESSAVHIGWEGRPAILYFLEDVTEKRKVERELLRVQKLESIGVLAGGVAHDFNNILTAILGNISLAKYCANSPEKMLGRLNQAEQACSRARVLTRQLLTFSKGGEPVKAVLSLHEVIVESCLFGLRGSNVRCEFSLPDNLWNVEADEGQVSQVFNNLVINAGQAMPEGGTILVEGRNVEVSSDQGPPLAPGKYARISVIDNGKGIPEEELSRVFDPYFTTKPGGSGLGLAIAYSVLKNHQGLITVESHPGKGAAFHVYLPASDQQTDDEEVTLRNLETGSGRVLLMDDEPAVRELAGELIELLGYEVAVSENGHRALQLYQEAIRSSRPFDVIILDLTVPGGMGGLELIKTIRKTDRQVKAIVSSGYSNDPVMSDYKAFGFDGITAKPYTAAELGHALRKVLREEDR